MTFLDRAGVRALAVAASFAPGGGPVIIRSLSPRARRIFELLDLEAEDTCQARFPRATNHEASPGLRGQSAETWPGRELHLLLGGPQEVTPMPADSFTVEVVEGVPVVAAPGEIDITNAEALRSALLKAAANGHGRLVVDMTRTQFCDLSGLHTLIAAHKRAQDEGGSLLLINPARAIIRVLEVTGLNRLLPSFTSLDQALAHVRRQAGQQLAT